MQEAAERSRLKRRNKLFAEVEPFLAFGETLLELVAGRRGDSGGEGRTVIVAATDQRLLVLRRRAFRQFSLYGFDYDDAWMSIGFTVEDGGALEIRDAAKSVRVDHISELDLEPFFAACRGRMDPARVEITLSEEPSGVWGQVPEIEEAEEVSEAPPEIGPEEVREVEAEEAPEVPGIEVEVEAEEAEEAPEVPGIEVEVEAEEAAEVPGIEVEAEEAAEVPGIGEAPKAAGEVEAIRALVWPSEAKAAPTEGEGPEDRDAATGQAQGALLRWLLAESGARAIAFVPTGPGSEERLHVEPRRLDAETMIGLVRLATRVAAAPSAVEEAPEDTLVARWIGAGGAKALVLQGVDPARAASAAALAQFVIEQLDASRPRLRPMAEAEGAAESGGAPSARPRLLEATVEVGESGRPTATVRLAWRGEVLTGHGNGHTSVIGRHLAAARAALDALLPFLPRESSVEHLSLSYPPMDAELTVVTVLVGGRRYVGAAGVPSGAEETAGARAVLDALNRMLARMPLPERGA